MFEKIYMNADGKDVSKYVIYAKVDTETGTFKDKGYAYADPELTKPINSDELENLFYAGLIVRGIVESGGSKQNAALDLLASGIVNKKYTTLDYNTLLCICPGSTSCKPIAICSSEYKPTEIG